MSANDSRANDSLPFYKRVDVPAHLRPAPPTAPSLPVSGRHPALPRESWEVLFAAHFASYRADLASRWPGDPQPYPSEYPPLPSAGDAPRWLAFINGVPMRSKGEEDMELDDGEAVDEEEAMNSAPPARPEPVLVAREPLVGVLQKLTNVR